MHKKANFYYGDIVQISHKFMGYNVFQIYYKESENPLIEVDKAEIKIIREQYPNVEYVRTMKQKSKRGRYYVAAYKHVIKLLESIRHCDVYE